MDDEHSKDPNADDQGHDDAGYNEVVEGESHPIIGNAVPVRILAQTVDYIVYLYGDDLRVAVEAADPSLFSEHWPWCVNRRALLESRPVAILPPKQRMQYKTLIGQFVVQVVAEGNVEAAEQAFKIADEYYQSCAATVSRVWGLGVTGSSCVVIAIVVAAVTLQDATGQMAWLGSIIMYGAIGVFLSIALRLGDVRLDPNAGKTAYVAEYAARVGVGAVAALLAVFAIRSGIVLPIADELLATTEGLAIVAIAAGATERFVPSLIRNLGLEQTEK